MYILYLVHFLADKFLSCTGEDLYSFTMLPVTVSQLSVPLKNNQVQLYKREMTNLTILTVTQSARSPNTGTTAKQNYSYLEETWAEITYNLPILFEPLCIYI